MSENSLISLTVPARASSVAVARHVVSSVGANVGFAFDAIDDLRLAVDEACALLLKMAATPHHFEIVVRSTADSMDLTISVDASVDPWPPVGSEDSLAWHLLSALSDEARFTGSGKAPAIQLTKRSGPPS